MPESLTIRTLIVDDEALARDGIRYHLESDADFVIVDEASHGEPAIEAIRTLKPDLVFLDVQMPGMSGFDLLRAIPKESLPLVVFVTAYDHYAIPAFEVNALDYLLKPIDPARFAAARDRVKSYFRERRQLEIARKLAQLLDQLQVVPDNAPNSTEPLKRIAISDRDTIYFVTVDEIDWIEAADYYVKLHTGKKTHLLRETLGHIEQKLDASTFLCIHRSTIVRIDRVRELKRNLESSYTVILKDGTQLKLSRNYRRALHILLGKSES